MSKDTHRHTLKHTVMAYHLALRTHPWRAGQGLGLARSVLSSPHLAQVADAGPQKPTRVPP